MRPDIGRSPVSSSSDLTVGFLRSSASVTIDRNGSINWFSPGTDEWVKMVTFSGSSPAAR